jgi:hypothetical protein
VPNKETTHKRWFFYSAGVPNNSRAVNTPFSGRLALPFDVVDVGRANGLGEPSDLLHKTPGTSPGMIVWVSRGITMRRATQACNIFSESTIILTNS